jgi:hypothetical protein
MPSSAGREAYWKRPISVNATGASTNMPAMPDMRESACFTSGPTQREGGEASTYGVTLPEHHLLGEILACAAIEFAAV